MIQSDNDKLGNGVTAGRWSGKPAEGRLDVREELDQSYSRLSQLLQ